MAACRSHRSRSTDVRAVSVGALAVHRVSGSSTRTPPFECLCAGLCHQPSRHGDAEPAVANQHLSWASHVHGGFNDIEVFGLPCNGLVARQSDFTESESLFPRPVRATRHAMAAPHLEVVEYLAKRSARTAPNALGSQHATAAAPVRASSRCISLRLAPLVRSQYEPAQPVPQD